MFIELYIVTGHLQFFLLNFSIPFNDHDFDYVLLSYQFRFFEINSLLSLANIRFDMKNSKSFCVCYNPD